MYRMVSIPSPVLFALGTRGPLPFLRLKVSIFPKKVSSIKGGFNLFLVLFITIAVIAFMSKKWM